MPVPFLKFYIAEIVDRARHNGEHPFIIGARVLLWHEALLEDEPGTLPDDEERLRRWSGLSPEEWAEAWPAIRSSWTKDTETGRWVIHRLIEQIEEQQEGRRRKKRAARVRWGGTGGEDAEVPSKEMHEQCTCNAPASPGSKTSLSSSPPLPQSPSSSPSSIPRRALKSLSRAENLGEKDTEETRAKLRAVLLRYPQHEVRLLELFERWFLTDPYPETVSRVFAALLDPRRQVQDAAGYARAIIGAEEPNDAEQRHIEEHERRKREEREWLEAEEAT